jgi:hypothetical protein
MHYVTVTETSTSYPGGTLVVSKDRVLEGRLVR